MHMQNLQQQQQQFQHQLQQQQLQHQHSMSGFMHPSMQGKFFTLIILTLEKNESFIFDIFFLGIYDRMYIWILVPFPFPLFPGFPGANPGAFNPLTNMPPFPIPQDMSGSALSQIILLLSPRT